MNLNHYITEDYENKSGLLTMEKQTQSNPTCGELVEPSKGSNLFHEEKLILSVWRFA